MNLYSLSETRPEYLEVGYARSGRSTCRTCKQKIEISTLRIAICMDDPRFSRQDWYHLPCFELKPRFKDVDPDENVYRIDELDPEDYDKVINRLTEQNQRLLSGTKKKKQDAKPSKKKGRSKKEDKSGSDDDESYTDKKKAKPAKDRKSKSKQSKQDRSKSSKSERSATKEKKKAAKKAPELVYSGYTPQQQALFQTFYKELLEESADKLKRMLAANGQAKTGTKAELAERCADGQLLGKIPVCTHCGGGKLRFNRHNGIYKCPGYMDDDVFKNCNKTYAMAEIVRDKWIKQ